jgi:hypothetical protein
MPSKNSGEFPQDEKGPLPEFNQKRLLKLHENIAKSAQRLQFQAQQAPR